ncbi:hypothetical protein MW887_008477 [Aspergillus wentii]|nr:hypothetical protein MW887_008477 [Aspergillus wentii]
MAGVGGTKRAASPSRPISPPPLKRKVESTVTKKAVSSFFTPASQKKPEPITWRILNNSLVIGKYAGQKTDVKQDVKRKIAAFDLVRFPYASSGNTFARNPSDWKWWDATVPSKIKELDTEGYQLVIVSNQKKVALQKVIKAGRSDSKSLANFKEKVAAVMSQLDVPLSVYAATKDDENRKPRIGMWREFMEDYDLDVGGVDLAGSFFVGDAAGRANDHSHSDRGFAANVGIPFKTPEEFFLNAAPEAPTVKFDPTTYLDDEAKEPAFVCTSPLDLVIFCGSPGAGKSTFFWNHLEPLGYERVNQDVLKTRPKCIKVAKEFLSDGKSVAVDNTNADPETRSHWIEVAKEFKIPIRCVYFITTPELCRHNNAVRAANQALNPESRTLLPGIAFGDFSRRFKEPSLDEGFKDIIRVDFRFRGNEDAKKVWSQYWI